MLATCGSESTGDKSAVDAAADAAPMADAARDAAPGLDASPDATTACIPPTTGTAPTYSQLYTKYFAVGTPGHCAKSGCHGGSGNSWVCGPSKDSCYAGMVAEGLINPSNPTASLIGNPTSSPLRWVNAIGGFMPQDSTASNPAGRDDIQAWVRACAQNN